MARDKGLIVGRSWKAGDRYNEKGVREEDYIVG